MLHSQTSDLRVDSRPQRQKWHCAQRAKRSFLASMALLLMLLAAGCSNDNPQKQVLSLTGTTWSGSLDDSITQDGQPHAVRLDCTVSFIDKTNATFRLAAVVDGQNAGQQTAAVTYTFNGQTGQMVEGAEVVDFNYDEVAHQLTVQQFYVRIAQQRVGGDFVLNQQ